MAKASASPTAATPDAATRVLILHGKERFLSDQYLRSLRDALAKAHGEDGVDTVRFDGAQGGRIVADVLDELRSFGLMQQYKIVLVDNADAMLKGEDDDAAPAPPPVAKGKKRAPVPHTPRELLENYCEDPSSSATLVLRASNWRPGNLDKAVAGLPKNAGLVIKCEPPDEGRALSWAIKRCQMRHNSAIDENAARMLIAAVGADLGRIDTELEKLALAAGGDGEPITAELVERMVGTTREEDFWSIQSELLTGDAQAALNQLRQLIEVSRHDPVPIGFSYTDLARKVHLAACGLRDGVNAARITGALRIWGPRKDEMVEGILTAAKALGPLGSAELLRACINADVANKSGLGEPVRNLERLTVRFANARGATGARR